MRYVLMALGIGALMTGFGITFAHVAGNLVKGCAPWTPDVIEFHPGVHLCPGQTVIMPTPKENTAPNASPAH